MQNNMDIFNEELKKARAIEDVDELYYAKSYLKNIYQEMPEKHVRMFCKGGGKELLPKDGKKEKAACLYSSSMLAYNFFSWICTDTPLVYEGVKYDKVVFEEQFRVLKSRNNKANLDVVLVGKDSKNKKTILSLESKFTEHLAVTDKMPEISDAYDLPSSYYANCKGDSWVSIVKKLRNMSNGEKAYYEGLKQVFCHLIGISSVVLNEEARRWLNKNSWLNHLEGVDLEGDEKYIFKSIVFCPNTEKEKNLTKDYITRNNKFVKGIDFLPKNIIIDNPIITYRDIWEKGMKESIKDKNLKEYLENYLKVHV